MTASLTLTETARDEITAKSLVFDIDVPQGHGPCRLSLCPNLVPRADGLPLALVWLRLPTDAMAGPQAPSDALRHW